MRRPKRLVTWASGTGFDRGSWLAKTAHGREALDLRGHQVDAGAKRLGIGILVDGDERAADGWAGREPARRGAVAELLQDAGDARRFPADLGGDAST
jgi:hypothetical protein